MEITVQNYRQLRNSFDTTKLNAAVLEVFNDVDADFEDYLELYTDASPENDGIRDVVNNHIKLVNKYFVDEPKEAKPAKPKQDLSDTIAITNEEFDKLKNISTTKLISSVNGNYYDVEFLNGDRKVYWIRNEKLKEPLVIYKEGKFITRKTLQSDYSFTENENLAYTWTESERSAAEKTAKIYDGLVITMSEAKKLTELMLASKANREKTYPSKTKKETPTDNAKKLGQLLYEYANLSNRMVKVMSSSKSVAETLTYDQLNDKLQKTVTEISYLIDGNYSEAREYIKEWVTKNGSLFVFEGKKYLEAAKQAYNIEQKPKAQSKTKPAPKAKVAKVIDKTIVDNLSPEFLLIRRFWNIIKTETVHVPFRTVQLLYMAFNKAAVERKVRKVSEAAELFTACNKKIVILFEDIPNESQKPYEIEFTDKKLYNEIKEYVSDVAVNPAIPLLKRFIAMQNTKPEIKKAETLLKSMEKIYVDEKPNRLKVELNKSISELQDYIKKPSQEIEPTVYGLSVPKVCKNRVKCSGLTPQGRLKKGYRFEEDSNNVIKVVKGLGSPKVCKNRVKCAGLTSKGQLRPGYKFREDTNEVVRVSKTPAKRKPTAKKAPVKKKVVVGLGFSDSIEKIYTDPLIPITNEPYTPEIEPAPAPKEQISQPAMEQPVVKNKLMNMQFDSLQMDEGWENFMQNPAKNLKMAIWGAPKNGKTAGSLQLANYLSKFGKVLYNFADQGFNKSTQDLWQMSGLANNPKAEPSDVQTLEDLEKEIATGKYSFVFIDMISDYINKEGIKPYEFKERFMKKYPKVSFVLVFEVTKGGNFKGDQGWTHIVDAIVTVEDFLMENRGRYGVGSHIVWAEGLKKFNPKRYEEVMDELQPVDLAFNEVEKI